MSLRISDAQWACVAAVCPLGIAAFIMFVIRPGGFEGAIGWFFLLLPGALPANVVSNRIYQSAPRIESVIFWTLIISLSFCWYWGIGYALIKISRGLVHAVRR
jgi:hypothetical protein